MSAFSLIKQHDIAVYKPYLDDYDFSSFNDFVVDIIGDQPDLYKEDRLFWPQSNWFYYKEKRVKYDRVIRYENLAQDAKPILKKIGKAYQDMLHALKTEKPHYKKMYSAQAADIVGEIYKKDVNSFNYKFD